MDLFEQKQWFDSPQFEKEYHSDLPLGAFCRPDGTIFRLWAPTAEAVSVLLYADGGDSAPVETGSMTLASHGVWLFESPRNLDGCYYEYEVTVGGEKRRTADPYARACGINGVRSMVLDLRRTDPEGWQEDKAPAHTPEQVIWELHVKDFSWDPAGGFDAADRGKYSALCRTGTTLNHDGVHPTGLDYLKRLGVTHVQLLPVYDFGSVDEAGPADQYNWGYDPVNYNCPEGSYSSDPHHGEVRVRELKQAIQSLHKNGFRVIMDVVYNHTYKLDSCLMRTAPWYYYRQKEDGTCSNGSGCGSEIASERSMCARYILESVLYWADEYHMDGFRFDLMGLMDVELMNNIQTALDNHFGVGEKLIYGEPWYAEPGAVRPGTVLCTKDNLKQLDPRIGAFCDATRDAVKGSLMNVNDRGFVNGGGMSAGKLYHCFAGWAAGSDGYYQAPSQTITYLSCHDDWTLWDKLVLTMDPDQKFEELQPAILRANRMAAAINFCCQGRPFLLAGEEFGRTKGGVKNSYCSSPDINRLDWSRAWNNRELVDYYRGLIALRMQLPALQDKTSGAAGRIISSVDLARNCVGLTAVNDDTGSSWDKILLLCNADDQERELPLPTGTWQVLADDISSFRWNEFALLTDHALLPSGSAWLLGRIKK